MNIFEHLNTPHFILISLGCYVITFVARTLIEFHAPIFSISPYYRKVVLPIFPVICGLFISLSFGPLLMDATISGYYPFVIAYGAVAGMVSGFIFRSIKGLIQAKNQNE